MASEDDLARARHAIGTMESGNRYDITGPATGSDVPLGRYQVMRSNLPSWSQAALGRQVTPQEFLSTPGLQDQVFNHRFGSYLDKHGPEGASRAWFGGEGSVNKNDNSRDVLGTSVKGYGGKFMSLFGGGAGDDGPMASSSGAPGDRAPGTGSGAFDPSAMTDDELKNIAGGGQTDQFDPAAMSDDELKAVAGGGSDGSVISPENMPNDSFDTAFGKDLKENIVGGTLGVIKRTGSDIAGLVTGKPQQAAGDVLSILKATNPFMAAVKGVQQGVEAVKDPAKALTDATAWVREHPATLAANALTAGAPGLPGKAAAGAVTKTAGAVDAVAAPTLGRLLTGVSGDAAKEAVQSGIAGGERSAAFKGQMRSELPPDQPVRLAEKAEQQINKEGQIAYGQDKARWPTDQHVDVSPVKQAISDALEENRTNRIVQNPEAETALQKLKDQFEEASTQQQPIPTVANPQTATVKMPGGGTANLTNAPYGPMPNPNLEVGGFDAMKRRMGNEVFGEGGLAQGADARRLAGKVYEAVKKAITEVHAPYGGTMAKSEQALEALNQLRRQLALQSPNDATILGKLQQALRNDASSRYGMTKKQLDLLSEKQPAIKSALAGQAFNSYAPRGLASLGQLTHVLASPLSGIPTLIASMPRLHGEVRHAIGSAVRKTGRAGASQENIGKVLDIARILGSRQNNKQD